MLRAFVNPLLLLVSLALYGLILTAEPTGFRPDVWLLTLCFTCCAVNGALALARALSHRAALMPLVWSVVFLILGSCAWVSISQRTEADPELTARYEALKQSEATPFAADAEGNSLFALAVELRHYGEVRRLLKATDRGDAIRQRAADAALLNAALDGDTRMMRLLLEEGANADSANEEGDTALMIAVTNNNPAEVRLLTEHGADTAKRNAEGRDAASYSRNTAIDDILASKPR